MLVDANGAVNSPLTLMAVGIAVARARPERASGPGSGNATAEGLTRSAGGSAAHAGTVDRRLVGLALDVVIQGRELRPRP